MKKGSDNDFDKISARIPKSLHKQLKQFCLDNETKIQIAIKVALENFLKTKDKK